MIYHDIAMTIYDIYIYVVYGGLGSNKPREDWMINIWTYQMLFWIRFVDFRCSYRYTMYQDMGCRGTAWQVWSGAQEAVGRWNHWPRQADDRFPAERRQLGEEVEGSEWKINDRYYSNANRRKQPQDHKYTQQAPVKYVKRHWRWFILWS